MGDIVVILGGIIIVLNAIELIPSPPGEEDATDWKNTIGRLVAGLAVVGVGLLLNHLGI